jgi:hydrogenase expression/formation protein HypD
MRYIDEYRNKDILLRLSRQIHKISRRKAVFMEVCGTHTMAVHKFGIPSILPENIRLVSGPGCPVCVTGLDFIDQAIELGKRKDVTLVTFGDLMKVPGSSSSLDKERAAGADVRIVYSVMDALEMAANKPDRKVIFLGIGFETTAPTTAVAILQAEKQKLLNFYVLSTHKVMPPVMKVLVREGVRIDGYLAPGHVSAITGTGIYRGIAKDAGIPVVVAGFEPVDIVQAILMLVEQVEKSEARVAIQYRRVVKPGGNTVARKAMETVFEPADDDWRGFGTIPGSGLRIRKRFERLDAKKYFGIKTTRAREPKGCICGELLKGLKTPLDCRLFAKACHPENPVGACMVSGEGICAAYYRYERKK